MTYVPVPDPDSREFWAAAAERRLIVQRCSACGHLQFFPRPSCLACRSEDVGWQEVEGRGEVHSFTVVRRAPTRELAERAPYVVALVDLDEGVRMMTNIVDCDPDSVTIGRRVEVDFRELAEGFLAPMFRLLSQQDQR